MIQISIDPSTGNVVTESESVSPDGKTRKQSRSMFGGSKQGGYYDNGGTSREYGYVEDSGEVSFPGAQGGTSTMSSRESQSHQQGNAILPDTLSPGVKQTAKEYSYSPEDVQEHADQNYRNTKRLYDLAGDFSVDNLERQLEATDPRVRQLYRQTRNLERERMIGSYLNTNRQAQAQERSAATQAQAQRSGAYMQAAANMKPQGYW